MRFELEVQLEAKTYGYAIAFELPEGSKELRVFDERLSVDGNPVYSRGVSQGILARSGQEKEPNFLIEEHMAALPIIQHKSEQDPLFVFRQWLARALLLRPIPNLIHGTSGLETLQPDIQATNFASWFTTLLTSWPSAYSKVDAYLRQMMPDLKNIENQFFGINARRLVVHFSNGQGSASLPFEDLSDGEKCFMICAVVLAANETYGPLLCFWDEPDNYLSLSEVGHFVLALRRAFQTGGQFIATSHNSEAIRRFSDENTLVLLRRNHLEPAIVRPLSELRASGELSGDLIESLITGDLEP